MPIPVVCPSCGNNISAPDHVAGRTLRCFKCLNPFTVPNVVPSPAPVAPMAQLAPSFGAAPASASAPPPSFELPPEPVPASTPPPSFELSEEPALTPAPPPSFELSEEPAPTPPTSNESAGPDPFELTKEEPTWDAPMPATPQEELPSTQDLPLEEAAMELSPADEVEAPMEEAPMEEAPEEVVEEPEAPRKSRKLAAVLALLPFSMHRFYLGYTKSAVVQILLWCVGIGAVWQVFDFLRLLFGVGFRKDGRGVPLR